MIKPDWNKFKAKFSDNPQNNFEWFCYLLFCKEFTKPYGIFRYKNQSAIETDPIEVGEDIIGWQAKFYDTALSSHKGDLLETVIKAKRDYPKITKLFLYTNREWGQYKGKKPKGLIEIEQKAKALNIELEWRAKSYFESKFVSIDNEIIAKQFFSLDNSAFDLIEEQKSHSESILSEIKTSISYNNQFIEIDRSETLEELGNETQRVVIVSGVGGSGKTAFIKKLYEQLKEKTPFYIFKATEFELRNINEFFGNYNLKDFIKIHADEKDKTIVIDSAEKLLDLRNTDPFKEFISTLIENAWVIIFTTRDNYVEDLNYLFFEIYKISPLNLKINNLELKELRSIAENYSFNLPKDEKLLELIKNPFYLSKYLQFYTDQEELNYSEFKNELWNKIIRKSKPSREQCFLKIAFERANKGQFFIIPDCESKILGDELTNDGILSYETAGYFITHDIYEEWALEKIIETNFANTSNESSFFNAIGHSLPVRRSFRSWLSEQLSLSNELIFSFIESVIQSNEIESCWKDEVLISVLLSDYSEIFFHNFKEELLASNQELLNKLTFLLRIACKEIDNSLFQQLSLKNLDLFSLKFVLTKPKGHGWQQLIKFVFENLDRVGLNNLNLILPAIHDWNKHYKKGETTKSAGLIALKYYQWLIQKDVYFSRDNTKSKLLETIINSSSEIENEFKAILEEIVKNKWNDHGAPYYDLSKTILKKIDGIPVCRVLPNQVLQLADLFWYEAPEKSDLHYDSFYSSEVESKYCLAKNIRHDCFPPSAYQTPIYWLLQSSLQKTIDFILEFTNKTIECYAQSNFEHIEEVTLFVSDNVKVKQNHSGALWGMYRGTGSPVTPYLMQSIHMALEKYLLEIFKNADSKIIEGWLTYLLNKSKSSSITSVVTSIVLAYPEKTFGVATILFKTKEFIKSDLARSVLESSAKSLYQIASGPSTYDKLFQEERIKTCDDKHRHMALEHLFLNYQFFKSEETSEEEVKQRQETLWNILDHYYKELPDESEQTEKDKVWRLFLARVDRRKMNPTTEEKDGKILIKFNPDLDSKLEEYSESSQQELSKRSQYLPLQLWARNRLENNDQYDQYETDPKLALKEVKEIISQLENSDKSDDNAFYIFNHATPGTVCSVLIRHYLNELTKEEQIFCKDIVIEVAASGLSPDYQYQISDGVETAISTLPIILKKFPEEKEDVKVVLLLVLFDPTSIGMYKRFADYAIEAIQHDLWETNFKDAQSLLFGYLLLKPKQEEIRKKLHEENYNNNRPYGIQRHQVMEKLLKENEMDLYKVVENKLSIEQLGEIEQVSLHTLLIAFQLLPLKTENDDHKKIAKIIISAFSIQLKSKQRDDKIDYSVKHAFLETLANFILYSKKEDIQGHLKPFLDDFDGSEYFSDLFQEFILAEDRLNTYENFWKVWDLFKEPIIKSCKKGVQYWYTDKLVKSYLFAQTPWNNTTVSWRSLRDENKTFIKEMSQKLGHCPSALYAISKLLNDIGSPYLNDGMVWVSNMLKSNNNLSDSKLETNTIYYIENIMKKYIYENREKIRKTKKRKEKVLVILNYLIGKGSVVGYILRENIL